MRILILATTLGVVVSIPLAGQQGRVSEKEVDLETRFIDANREHLLGNYDKAIPIYEDILKRDPANDASAFELARIYAQKEDNEKAQRYAQLAVRLNGENVWYQQFLADIYQKTGRNREAAALFEQLVKQAPNQEDYYFKWAYFLVRANDIDRAVRVYDQLESRVGISEELIRRKFALYRGIGDARRAGQELERLVKAFPGNTEYLHQLAEFFDQAGDAKRARETYQRVLAIDPNDAKARLALAGGSQATTDELQYLQSLQPIFQSPAAAIDPKIRSILPVIQRVADTGDRSLGEAALALTSTLEQVHPDEAKGFAASADLLFYLGRRAEAIEKYRRAIELDDTVYPVWEQLLYALLGEGAFKQLRTTAEETMDLFPNNATAYFLYGAASDELGMPREALPALRQALLMASNDEALRFQIQGRLGRVYDALGDFAESDGAFEAALALNSRDATLLGDYSYALARRGAQLDKARSMAASANVLEPNQPHLQDVYGWVLYKLKEFNEARTWLERALENGASNNPQTLEHYGDLLFQLNETEEAIQYWKMAQEKGSRSELLEKKITDKQLYE